MLDTDDVYNCDVRTGREDVWNKYICQGWYSFARDYDLIPGDILRFLVADPPANLYVRIIRLG